MSYIYQVKVQVIDSCGYLEYQDYYFNKKDNVIRFIEKECQDEEFYKYILNDYKTISEFNNIEFIDFLVRCVDCEELIVNIIKTLD